MIKKEISMTDIDLIKVGHATRKQEGSGCTVILCEEGALCGCDVRGGGPATRETELLKPVSSNDRVHAVVLSGGSAFGLDTCSGAMQYLEEKNIGISVRNWKIPIVTGACIFDFPMTNGQYKPDQNLGYEACCNASKNEIEEGNIGAGMGATVGKMLGIERSMKSGLGTYGIQIDDLQVAVIVSVNALGDVIDITSGKRIAGVLSKDKTSIENSVEALYEGYKKKELFTGNTTIGCVVTNARLEKGQINKVASMTHNGFARAISPVHTSGDGDTVFAMTTGTVEATVDVVGVLAAECMAKAINRAVEKATSVNGFIAMRDLEKKMYGGMKNVC